MNRAASSDSQESMQGLKRKSDHEEDSSNTQAAPQGKLPRTTVDASGNVRKLTDKEYRRMRRRVTNRESAKRMRIKRQEEMATSQHTTEELKAENQQLHKYSADLQRQHIVIASDLQQWQQKYETCNRQYIALYKQFQQLQQLVSAQKPDSYSMEDTLAPEVIARPSSSDSQQSLGTATHSFLDLEQVYANASGSPTAAVGMTRQLSQTSAASTASRLCAYGSNTSLSGYQTPVETIMAAAAQGGRCHYSEAIASAMYDDVMPMEYMAQGSVGKDPFMVYAH